MRRALVVLVVAASTILAEIRHDEGGRVSVSRTRSVLYSLARFLGDYQPVKNDRIGKRLARRAAGRVTGRGLGGLFR